MIGARHGGGAIKTDDSLWARQRSLWRSSCRLSLSWRGDARSRELGTQRDVGELDAAATAARAKARRMIGARHGGGTIKHGWTQLLRERPTATHTPPPLPMKSGLQGSPLSVMSSEEAELQIPYGVERAGCRR